MISSKNRTYVAGEALSAGDVVYLSTTNKLMQVDTTYANIIKVVGVVATDVASGSDAAIKTGRVLLPASGTVNAGSKIRLGSGIAGVIETYAITEQAELILGYAEETKYTTGTNSGSVLCWLN